MVDGLGHTLYQRLWRGLSGLHSPVCLVQNALFAKQLQVSTRRLVQSVGVEQDGRLRLYDNLLRLVSCIWQRSYRETTLNRRLDRRSAAPGGWGHSL